MPLPVIISQRTFLTFFLMAEGMKGIVLAGVCKEEEEEKERQAYSNKSIWRPMLGIATTAFFTH